MANYFSSSVVASYTVIRSDHNKSNLCPRQSLVFWIHSYCWVRDKSIHHIKATLPHQGYSAIPRLLCHSKATFAISRLLCHTTATLPYQGYSAISRSLCHTTATLPYQGYYAIARLFCHIKVTLPYHGYIAISKLLCHQCEASLPPIQAQRLQDHPWPSLIISFDLLLLELQTNECNGQSKTHQKLFQ